MRSRVGTDVWGLRLNARVRRPSQPDAEWDAAGLWALLDLAGLPRCGQRPHPAAARPGDPKWAL